MKRLNELLMADHPQYPLNQEEILLRDEKLNLMQVDDSYSVFRARYNSNPNHLRL